MTTEIVTRYSGIAQQPTVEENGDGDHIQITIFDHKSKTERIIFTGSKFSREGFEARDGSNRERWLPQNYQKLDSESEPQKEV